MDEQSGLYSDIAGELERRGRPLGRRTAGPRTASRRYPTRPRKPPRRPRPWPWFYPAGWGGSFVDITSVQEPIIDYPPARTPDPTYRPVATASADCQEAVVLDGFEKGDYRIRLHHYEPLHRFIKRVSGLGPRSGSESIVRIAGHTDSGGTPKMNQGLSFSRAFEVERFLISMLGNVATEVSAHGSSRPVASNSTEAGRRRNRRVELMLCAPGAGPSWRAGFKREFEAFTSEIDELCRQAARVAEQLREALARARESGASEQDLKRIRDIGFRWITENVRVWRPRVASLSNRDLDRLIGCLARVASALGVEPHRLRTLRNAVARRLGVPV